MPSFHPIIPPLVAAAMCVSSTAAAAAAPVARPIAPAAPVSAWTALSALGSQASAGSFCAATIAAQGAAVAAQAAQPGCVLPVIDQPVAPTVGQAPLPPAPVAASPMSLWPILLGLAAVVGFGFLLSNTDDDQNRRDLSPR